MLNDITIARRAELRKARALLLALTGAAAIFGAAALCVGLWEHCIPIAACSLLVVPVVRALTSRLRALRCSMRLLGI